jgi:hypothetical protein
VVVTPSLVKCGGEAAIPGDRTWTNGQGGGEGPWRALNMEEKSAEEKIFVTGRSAAGPARWRRKGERGGLLGVGMREVGVRPGVASGAVEGGAWRQQRRTPGGGGRWSTTNGVGEVAL